LAAGAREIRVILEHNTKEGAPRIRKRCHYPLTAAGVVKRIYTNLAVIDVTPDGLITREIVPGLDFAGLQERTEAKLGLANDWRVLEAPAV
jgi:3-oxoadipate CoA-transferase, beta subunit